MFFSKHLFSFLFSIIYYFQLSSIVVVVFFFSFFSLFTFIFLCGKNCVYFLVLRQINKIGKKKKTKLVCLGCNSRRRHPSPQFQLLCVQHGLLTRFCCIYAGVSLVLYMNFLFECIFSYVKNQYVMVGVSQYVLVLGISSFPRNRKSSHVKLKSC